MTLITIDVTGLAELETRLLSLGEDITLNIVKRAGMKAMQAVVSDMTRNAGYDPKNEGEHMRDTIKVRAKQRMKDSQYPTLMTFSVGPSRPHTIKARAQEFGTYKQTARPFMRPALDNNIPKIINTLTEEIRRGINNKRG